MNSSKLYCIPDRGVGGPPAYWIILIDIPLVVIFGLLGNCLSILVMRRKKFRNNTTSTFIIALAVSDSVFLLTNLLMNDWIKIITCFDIRESTLATCKALMYIVWVSKAMAAWLLVCLSLERLVMVAFPLQAKLKLTIRRTKCCIFLMLCIVLIIYSYVPVRAGIQEANVLPGCDFSDSDTNRNVTTALNIFDLVFYSLLPSWVLIISNSALYYMIRVRKRKISTEKEDSESLRLTVTLATVSVSHFLLTIPMTVWNVIDLTRYPDQKNRTLDIWFIALYTLNIHNNAINFLLYCFSGPSIRQELKLMCFRRSCQNNRLTAVVPDTNAMTIPSVAS